MIIDLLIAIVLSTALVSTTSIMPKVINIITLEQPDNVVVTNLYISYIIAFIYFCISSPMMLTIIFSDSKIETFIKEAAEAIMES